MKKEALNELKDFWDINNFSKGTYINNEDHSALQENLVACKDFKEYIDEYLDKASSNKKRFHQNLYPVPYCGNLADAKVYIMSLNPGLDSDYYDESDKDFKAALKSNLAQDGANKDYPLFYLDPKFCWTGSARYWLKKFSQIIEKLINDKIADTHTKALKLLAAKVCLLEWLPYHSAEGPRGKMELPSFEKMKTFVKDYVIPRAEEGKCVLIVLRRGSKFEFEKKSKVIVLNSGESRGANFNKYYDEIKKFLTK